MNGTRAHLTVDIAGFAPIMFEYLSESATAILSPNGRFALVYLGQKKNYKRLSKLYLLIDLKTAQVKCAGRQSERESFAFLEAQDDHLFRIRARPERVRIDLLRVNAHWELEVVRTIARYKSVLRLSSITIDSLRQGFLIREKNGDAPGLGTLTERFELALLDGRRLLLKKTRRNWSFMASPERSRFRFAGSSFHYTFGSLPRAKVATVNYRTHKMRFRESRGSSSSPRTSSASSRCKKTPSSWSACTAANSPAKPRLRPTAGPSTSPRAAPELSATTCTWSFRANSSGTTPRRAARCC